MTRAQRVLGPIVLVILIVAVGFALVRSFNQARADREAARQRAAIVTVRGLVGSEKQALLTDPRLLAILRKDGIDLQIQTSGSREMGLRTDIKNYDFGFPAGEPAARRLMAATNVKVSYTPFFTPMAVASWKPIANILIANGIVKRWGDNYLIVDMKALLSAVNRGERWHDLKANSAFDVNKAVLISSTDVRKSNSGAMYLSLASYVFNDASVVSSEAQIQKVLPKVTGLFIRQGYQESSSSGPFDDYVTIGMGKAPLVMIYESQFIEYLAEHKTNRNGDMVLLYPQPTIYTKHTLVPLDPNGDKLGQLLQSDPELQKLAIEHGFRNENSDYMHQFLKTNGVKAPDQLLDVVDPPSYEVLEAMITSIERKYNLQPQ